MDPTWARVARTAHPRRQGGLMAPGCTSRCARSFFDGQTPSGVEGVSIRVNVLWPGARYRRTRRDKEEETPMPMRVLPRLARFLTAAALLTWVLVPAAGAQAPADWSDVPVTHVNIPIPEGAPPYGSNILDIDQAAHR